MLFNVSPRRVSGMFCRLGSMSARAMGVMSRFLMMPGIVMLGRFAMMSRGMLVVLRRMAMVLRCLLGHGNSPLVGWAGWVDV